MKQVNERWINNPERRVGRAQLQRALLAGIDEQDPRYRAYRNQNRADVSRGGNPGSLTPG